MKRIKYRVVSFALSICLFTVIFMSQTFKSYAVYDPGTSWWHKFSTEFGTIVRYFCNQYNAFVKGDDFSQWLKNQDDFEEWWNTGHISYNENTNSITADKEFMQWLKNCLINYSKQEQTFIYGWSTGFDEIPYSTFGSWSVCYQTIENVLATAPSGAINLALRPSFSNGEYSVEIYISSFDNLRDVGFVSANGSSTNTLHYSISTWERFAPDVYYLSLKTGDSAIPSWDEFKEKAQKNTYLNGSSIGTSDNYRRYTNFCSETQRNVVNTFFTTDTKLALVTRSRTTFRLFRSSDYLFDYSLGKRSIYFTSDFWDYEPSDFTATFDDINDSIDRMDDILERLLDRINDSSSESEIEDILKQILEELKNGNSGDNSGSGGTTGGSSQDYSGFFDSILGYLKTINSNIKDILDQLKKLKNWVIAGDVIDFISDLFDDSENSSKETVGRLSSSLGELASGLTEKFPFSIPWDIQYIFLQLSDTPKPPRFELPLYIKSFGIDEVIVVEMERFEVLSRLSRSMFSMLFAIYLINLTFKVVGLRKDE